MVKEAIADQEAVVYLDSSKSSAAMESANDDEDLAGELAVCLQAAVCWEMEGFKLFVDVLIETSLGTNGTKAVPVNAVVDIQTANRAAWLRRIIL